MAAAYLFSECSLLLLDGAASGSWSVRFSRLLKRVFGAGKQRDATQEFASGPGACASRADAYSREAKGSEQMG